MVLNPFVILQKNNIKKILYASSSSVYSDINEGKFCEASTPLKPKSKYGESKLSNEIYASNFIKSYDAINHRSKVFLFMGHLVGLTWRIMLFLKR